MISTSENLPPEKAVIVEPKTVQNTLKEEATTQIQITDKFLETERAACATLEKRLKNLAERATSRNLFFETSSFFEKQKTSLQSPVKTKSLFHHHPHHSKIAPLDIKFTSPSLVSAANDKENTSGDMSTSHVINKDEKRNQTVLQNKHSRDMNIEGSIDSSVNDAELLSEIERINEIAETVLELENIKKKKNQKIEKIEKSEKIENDDKSVEKEYKKESLEIGSERDLLSPTVPNKKSSKISQQSPFNVEEDDVEHVLGLIESLESRNQFLTNKLGYKNAEYTDLQSRLKESEDLLHEANQKHEKWKYKDTDIANLKAINLQLVGKVKEQTIELESVPLGLHQMQREIKEYSIIISVTFRVSVMVRVSFGVSVRVRVKVRVRVRLQSKLSQIQREI
jgi:hypothetical protein